LGAAAADRVNAGTAMRLARARVVIIVRMIRLAKPAPGSPRRSVVKTYDAPAQMMIPIVGPFGLQAAVIIHHAHMSALAAQAELLCGIDCEDNRLVVGHAGTIVAILDHPHVVVAYNIVSSI
jgi:hypothetical protein